MEEWKEYKLGDLIVLSSGGTPNKNNSSYWGGDIPWISAKAMYDDYLYSSDMTITREGLKNGSKLAPVNSILLLTRGSGLFNRIPICLVKREMAFNQDVKCIESINKNIVSTLFLFYWLIGNKQAISNILETTGIGAGKIDTERLKSIHIKLPPIQLQQVLIKFAESLMLKIEVNRRINDNFYYAFFEIMLIWLVISLENDNLEKQAQALFKSWFVDYEPFHNLPFIDSEQGRIPEGWCATVLEDLCSFISRGLTPKYDESSNELILGQTCVRNNIVTIDNARKHSPKQRTDKWVKRWDTLINSTGVGSLGRVGIVYFDMDNVAIDSHITVVRPKSALVRHYVGRNLLNRQLEIENMAIGSTGQTELPKDRVKSLPIILPDDNTLTRFNAIIEPIACLLYRNVEESRHITTLRDSLLPRLMSGELKINDLMM